LFKSIRRQMSVFRRKKQVRTRTGNDIRQDAAVPNHGIKYAVGFPARNLARRRYLARSGVDAILEVAGT